MSFLISNFFLPEVVWVLYSYEDESRRGERSRSLELVDNQIPPPVRRGRGKGV